MKARTYKFIGLILVGVGIMSAFLASAGMDGSSRLMTILALSAAAMCALVSGGLLIKASIELEIKEFYIRELEIAIGIEELS